MRICDVEVVSVRREPLLAVAAPYWQTENGNVIWPELVAEGFPDLGPGEFMRRYFRPQGIAAMDDVTRIEWRYLAAPESADA